MSSARTLVPSLVSFVLVAVAACGGDDDEPPAVLFELDGELAGDTFFDLPFPSDLRLDADGTPTYAGFPTKGNNQLVPQLVALADSRRGFSVMSNAHFRDSFSDADPGL
jgi:hypothetical protein